MENISKTQALLAKIVSVGGGGVEDCALMRLARANGVSRYEAQYLWVPAAKFKEGLTVNQINSVAMGWDLEGGRFEDGWKIAANVNRFTPDPEYLALGRTAARACGVAKPSKVAAFRAKRADAAFASLVPA